MVSRMKKTVPTEGQRWTIPLALKSSSLVQTLNCDIIAVYECLDSLEISINTCMHAEKEDGAVNIRFHSGAKVWRWGW